MPIRYRPLALSLCASLSVAVPVVPAFAANFHLSDPHADSASPTTAMEAAEPADTVTLTGVKVEGQVPYLVSASNTATRTDTPLLDIPQTIQALPMDLVHDQNAQSLGDTLRNAPGVSVHQGEGNRDEMVIRGVKTKADFFVNGVRVAQE